MTMPRFLERLLDRPEGPLAPILGWILAVVNRAVNRWTVDQLSLRPDDVVLEVGFGPGTGIGMVAETVTEGWIGGVDPSPAMRKQALRRNRTIAADGRLDLRVGPAEELPWPSARFSKAFSVNSIHAWDDLIGGLEELERILEPGGQVAITTQARWLSDRPESVEELGRLYLGNLEEVGFASTRIETRPSRPTPAVCLLGWKLGSVEEPSREIGAGTDRLLDMVEREEIP